MALVIGKCSNVKQLYAIRFEKHENGNWASDWTFAVPDGSPLSEDTNSQSFIDGRFELLPTYPGCPHCKAKSFYRCGTCRKVGCWNGSQLVIVCPHCATTSNISGVCDSLSSRQDG